MDMHDSIPEKQTMFQANNDQNFVLVTVYCLPVCCLPLEDKNNSTITHFYKSRASLIWNQLTSTLVLSSHISNQAGTKELGESAAACVVFDARHCANY